MAFFRVKGTGVPLRNILSHRAHSRFVCRSAKMACFAPLAERNERMSVTPVNPTGTAATPRVRFAPSPTGYLHVGGARTALFNWLFARSTGGVMILRIEDTDVERNKPELVEGILDGLRWLGLDWDEGPLHQSERLPLYRAAAEKLLASGAAFLCYCPPEKYAGGDAAGEGDADASGPRRVTRCPCREGIPRIHRKRPPCASAVPLGEMTRFDDAVFGPREVANDEIEDFVLLRSPKPGQPAESSLPTYQLGAVVDDIDMRITHVIRGADHLSNTPKQVLLYRALGAAPPIFAHVPLILGPDRTRLSKRHGATSVGSYRDEGFLSEAFRNFLALLGWSTGDDTEFMRTEELLRRFSLAGVSRTNAVFDRAKLEWFNTQYLQKLPIEDLLPAVESELRSAGLWREEWAGVRARLVRAHCGSAAPADALCCPISPPGRAHFSATSSPTIPPPAKNSGRTRACPICSASSADGLAALPGLESRRLRQSPARPRRRRGREGRPAHQRHARRHRRPGRRAAALRDDGRPRPITRRRAPPPRPPRSRCNRNCCPALNRRSPGERAWELRKASLSG